MNVYVINMIKSTSPAIKEKGASIITRMHQDLTKKDKLYKTLFPEEHIKDPASLQQMVDLLQVCLVCLNIGII